MKRKLVLIFEDNKLLYATLTERGRRVKLPKIVTNEDALAKVKDTLTDALSIVEEAPSTTTTINTAGPGGLAERLNAPGLTSGAPSGWSWPEVPAETDATLGAKPDPVETTPIASVQEQPRPRSVCARPKKDEKESLTIAPCN